MAILPLHQVNCDVLSRFDELLADYTNPLQVSLFPHRRTPSSLTLPIPYGSRVFVSIVRLGAKINECPTSSSIWRARDRLWAGSSGLYALTADVIVTKHLHEF